jgi:hypothetical protein
MRRKLLLGASAVLTSCALAVSFDDANTETWVVEGTVSGLGNERIALQLNGQRIEVGDGPFTSRRIANGSAYALTLEAQPRNGRCSIAGGEGTISGTNVTGVQVRCNQFYVVRGTVSGDFLRSELLLRLQRHGPYETVDVSKLYVLQPGPFAFSAPEARLPDGAKFTVTLYGHARGRACALTNGEGVIAGADANVVVTCVPAGPDLVALSVQPCSAGDVDAGVPCTGPPLLMPPFARETVAYTLSAPANCVRGRLCLTVAAAASHPESRIRVNGLPLVDGKANVVVSVASPHRTIDIEVTAPDGQSVRNYAVAVNVLLP